MSENVKIIAEKDDIVAIADAVRNKIGSTEEMSLSEIVSEINGIETGGGSSAKTTVTVNLDWSGDEQKICEIFYLSNNKTIEVYPWDGINQIEAQNGVIIMYDGLSGACSYTSNIIRLQTVSDLCTLVALQDGETIYLASTEYQ